MFESDFERLMPLLRHYHHAPLDAPWQAWQTRSLTWLRSQARYQRLPVNDYQEPLQLGGQVGQGSLLMLRLVVESLYALSLGKHADALAVLARVLEQPSQSDPFYGEAYSLGMRLADTQADAVLYEQFTARYQESRRSVGLLRGVQGLMETISPDVTAELAELLELTPASNTPYAPSVSDTATSDTIVFDNAAPDSTAPDSAAPDSTAFDSAASNAVIPAIAARNITVKDNSDLITKNLDTTNLKTVNLGSTNSNNPADELEEVQFIPPIARLDSYVSISAVADMSVQVKVFCSRPARILTFDAFLVDDIHCAMQKRVLSLDVLLEPRESAEMFLLDAREQIRGVRLLSKAQPPLTFKPRNITAREGAGARLRLKLRTPHSWQDLEGMFDGPAFWQQLAQIVILI